MPTTTPTRPDSNRRDLAQAGDISHDQAVPRADAADLDCDCDDCDCPICCCPGCC